MPAETNSRNRNVKNTNLLLFYPAASERRLSYNDNNQ